MYVTRTHTSWWTVLLWILQNTWRQRSTKMHFIFPCCLVTSTLPSTSSPSTHSSTKRVCLNAPSLIKTGFPIRAQNGYSEFSGSCCLRWQSNSSVFQSYTALVELILHPRPMPKNKALAAIHFKCDNVCVLHISSVSYIFF